MTPTHNQFAHSEPAWDGDDDPSIIRGVRQNNFIEVEAALMRDLNCLQKIVPKTGMSALHYAAALGNLSMVEYLLKQEGADLRLKDRFDRDVLDVAIECGHQGIVERLFQELAKQVSE